LRAQVVWHVICCVEQLSWHDALEFALLVVVAAPVGAVPGTTHAAWQFAAWELHVIMQLVTVEVCASRSFSAASASCGDPAIANNADAPANEMNRPRMTASLRFTLGDSHDSAAATRAECGPAARQSARGRLGLRCDRPYAVRM
jgi:hypothetical protein